ncbi:hypothetical protein V6N11_039427 [Hibiscus sabdariffa]|uniref:Uncharacterized protein n=1 Tax=Hibiscus sabdariffa TaxID=183260 RepID=A0ABR2SMV7_9ROSI
MSSWIFITIVYASPNARKRKQIWDPLLNLNPNDDTPWLVGGNFNAILHPDDICGGLGYLTKLENQLKAELDEVLAQEKCIWFQRARTLWIVHRDRNTNFYHALVLAHRWLNFIHGIRSTDGDLCMVQAELKGDSALNDSLSVKSRVPTYESQPLSLVPGVEKLWHTCSSGDESQSPLAPLGAGHSTFDRGCCMHEQQWVRDSVTHDSTTPLVSVPSSPTSDNNCQMQAATNVPMDFMQARDTNEDAELPATNADTVDQGSESEGVGNIPDTNENSEYEQWNTLLQLLQEVRPRNLDKDWVCWSGSGEEKFTMNSVGKVLL